MTGADAIAIIILLTILIAIGVYLLHWLYRHSSKDQSFVRTGSGGERVVMGGGALVIPIVHDITVVSMNAIPIEIRRTGEQSLITNNKMRVDLVAEFFVRVVPSKEGVSTAARTLGARTLDPAALKEMIQGRFVDAMSAVAASMTMEEIHQDRTGYISRVAKAAEGKLGTNGLELENASLTSLNQSDISVFDPSNAFDAEGLTELTEQIESRRKLRNTIEKETRIEIKLKDYEAESRALEIDRDLEYARIDQTREIEVRKAEQIAQIEAERSSSTISVTQARVKAEEEAERIQIAKTQAVDSERIRSENDVRAFEIERQEQTEIAEIASQATRDAQRIQNRQQVESERIERERQVREADIKARHDISLYETKTDEEVENARLQKQREVESSRIDTEKAIELLAVEKQKDVSVKSEQAAAEKDRATNAKRHAVETDRLKKDEDIVQHEIAKKQKIRLAETETFKTLEDAQIVANREVEELRITAQKYIDRFIIEQDLEVELADKERLISVVNKAIEEAVARTKEAEAQRKLAATEAQIETARAEESANRSKRVNLIEAESRVEREALRLTKIAEAEKAAVEQKAEADIAESKAAKVRYDTDAEGSRKLNEAENMRSEEARRSAIYEHLVKTLPQVIRESVKPMESIESIKILQVDGLPGLNSPSENGNSGGSGNGAGSGNVSDQVVNSAMKYRTQVAFVDGLMEEIGLPLKNLGSAGGMTFRNFPAMDVDNAADDNTTTDDN